MGNPLKRLDKDTKKGVARVAAEYNYAVDLLNDLDQIRQERKPSKGLKEVKQAIRLLRWIGQAERRVDQSEKKIILDLDEVRKLGLPAELQATDRELTEKLRIQEAQLVRLASMFLGKIKGELERLKTDEALLDHYEQNPGEAMRIRSHLNSLLVDTKKEVESLIRWVRSTEVVLSSVRGLSRQLLELAA